MPLPSSRRDYAVDDRHLAEDRAAKLQNVIDKAVHEPEEAAAIDLRPRRVLDDYLCLLGGRLIAQFRRNF